MGTSCVTNCTSPLLDLESQQVADKPWKIREGLGRSLQCPPLWAKPSEAMKKKEEHVYTCKSRIRKSFFFLLLFAKLEAKPKIQKIALYLFFHNSIKPNPFQRIHPVFEGYTVG